jgi:hypothetical protein
MLGLGQCNFVIPSILYQSFRQSINREGLSAAGASCPCHFHLMLCCIDCCSRFLSVWGLLGSFANCMYIRMYVFSLEFNTWGKVPQSTDVAI